MMVLVFLLLFSINPTPAQASVATVLERIDDRYHPDHLPYDWDGAVMLWGMARLGLRKPELRDRIRTRLGEYYGTFSELDPRVNSPDLAAAGLGAALLKLMGGDEGDLIIRKAQDFLHREPRNYLGTLNHVGHYHRFRPWLPLTRRLVSDSIWGDSMVMYVLNGHFVAKAQGDRKLAQFIASQPAKFIEKLQHENGLYRHAYFLRKQKVSPRDAAWLRGHGWVMASIAELMEEGHTGLEESFKQAADATLRYQNEFGMWHTIVEGMGREETSGTALVVYALAKGHRLGVLERRHLEAAQRGWRAIQDKLVSRRVGEGLRGCSGYTNAMRYARMYVSLLVRSNRETPFCLGTYLLAASELE